MRYLEPPHLDINRTLACTTYHPLSYALSRLTRARTGVGADPFAVMIEPDLAESWDDGIRRHRVYVPAASRREDAQQGTRLRPRVRFRGRALS